MKQYLKKLLQRYIKKLIDAYGWDFTELSVVVDYDPEDIKIINDVRPFTMTNHKRLHALIQAVKYVVTCDIPGAIVECGVYKGGSMMAAAKTLLAVNCQDRCIYLYDTFEGMKDPSSEDLRYDGKTARQMFDCAKKPDGKVNWCCCSLEDVQKNMFNTGYDAENIKYIKGRVEDTIPKTIPEEISILRLDTDWYASTQHELTYLFPRLAKGGIIIVDDYGYWQGVRRVVDGFIAQNRIKLFLNRVDYACRIGVKI